MRTWIREARALACTFALSTLPGSASQTAMAQSSPPASTSADVISTFELPVSAGSSTTTSSGAAARQPRTVYVDAAPFVGGGRSTPTGYVGEFVVYDLDAVLRPVSSSSMRALPEWAVAVRLVLSEVGADRMLNNRYGLVEAMGVIETVYNRLDPARYNPAGIAGLAAWPGCHDGASFASCANPQQYYGMSTPRALNPSSVYRNRDQLLRAIDVAVSAWWLIETDVVADVTRGATSFAHRCGGSRYGQDQGACSGLEAVTGPIVFTGPRVWLRSQGRYEMSVTRRVDYRSGGTWVEPGFYAAYLWGGQDDLAMDEGDFTTDPEELDEIWRTGSAD